MNRTIDLAGCLNFRDLGGYPTADGRAVRWRRVFRSDALHHLSRQDVARLRDELGLAEVIDLRSTAELRSEGRGPLASETMRFHHQPLYDGNASRAAPSADLTLADRYVLLAEFAQRPIASIIAILANSDAPAVYHCAAGKDRTGVVSAILLGVLGVPDEVIIADYAATQENLDAIIDRLMSTKGYHSMLSALPPDTLHAEPETMIAFLERMRGTYGSMAGYARTAGAPDETIERLRERLLTDESVEGDGA
jgi:protein-tyrosine phosphatase